MAEHVLQDQRRDAQAGRVGQQDSEDQVDRRHKRSEQQDQHQQDAEDRDGGDAQEVRRDRVLNVGELGTCPTDICLGSGRGAGRGAKVAGVRGQQRPQGPDRAERLLVVRVRRRSHVDAGHGAVGRLEGGPQVRRGVEIGRTEVGGQPPQLDWKSRPGRGHSQLRRLHAVTRGNLGGCEVEGDRLIGEPLREALDGAEQLPQSRRGHVVGKRRHRRRGRLV